MDNTCILLKIFFFQNQTFDLIFFRPFSNNISLKNVLKICTEEIVRKAAVRIVTCQRPVTKKLVRVMAVVKRDGNLPCVLKVLVIRLLLHIF